jgi:hypothetical protein
MKLKFILTEQMNHTLMLLAKRNDDKLEDWSSWKFPTLELNDPEGSTVICHICNNELDISNILEHGVIHLKNSNLLPFL